MILMAYYLTRSMMWVRIFGYGICVRRIADHPLRFSERNGFRKVSLRQRMVCKFPLATLDVVCFNSR